MSRRREKDDIELGTGEKKDNEKRLQFFKYQDQDAFIRKGYLLCLMLFLATGCIMITAVLEGAYKEVILAETILVTVLGSIYIVLFVIMVCCYGATQLRIALLLFISFFIGVVGGFMVGVNLKVVVSHLQEGA